MTYFALVVFVLKLRLADMSIKTYLSSVVSNLGDSYDLKDKSTQAHERSWKRYAKVCIRRWQCEFFVNSVGFGRLLNILWLCI